MPRKKKVAEADLDASHLPVDAENPAAGDLGPVKHPVIHPKAIVYVREMRSRLAAGKREKAAHDDLLQTMLTEGIPVYEYGGVTVNVQNNPKVRATAGDTEEGDE